MQPTQLLLGCCCWAAAVSSVLQRSWPSVFTAGLLSRSLLRRARSSTSGCQRSVRPLLGLLLAELHQLALGAPVHACRNGALRWQPAPATPAAAVQPSAPVMSGSSCLPSRCIAAPSCTPQPAYLSGSAVPPTQRVALHPQLLQIRLRLLPLLCSCCQVSAADVRKAHAIHPVAAYQLEWSLWSRDAEVGGLVLRVSFERLAAMAQRRPERVPPCC